MTQEEWRKLRPGSIIAGNGKKSVPRKVLENRGGCVTLTIVRGGYVRLFIGGYRENVAFRDKTCYVLCDCKAFRIIKK